MKKFHLSITTDLVIGCAQAVLLVAFITAPMALIGRQVLGEAVIAMLYLAAVGLSSSRWGQLPGMCAALTAALTFDFFFIPPFFTFAVGQLEGWLVLAIFLGVAFLVVGRIQDALARAHTSERDAKLTFELGMALAGLRTQEAVIHALAWNLQQLFRAALVEIVIETGSESVPAIVKAPEDLYVADRPDRVVPIMAAPGLIGEIHVWRGNGWLPHEDSRLLPNLAALAATALERARTSELELRANTLAALANR
jgi:K+-sensing histidine kinase KdpD